MLIRGDTTNFQRKDLVDSDHDSSVIEFDPRWFDDRGLPVFLGDWALERLAKRMEGGKQGDKFQMRYSGHRLHREGAVSTALAFEIHCINDGFFGARFWAVFHLTGGGQMIVMPGLIDIQEEGTPEGIGELFYEYDHPTEGKQWNKVRQRSLTNHYSYSSIACPTYAMLTARSIDHMAFKMFKDSRHGVKIFLELLAGHGKYSRAGVLTDGPLRRVFNHVSAYYRVHTYALRPETAESTDPNKVSQDLRTHIASDLHQTLSNPEWVRMVEVMAERVVERKGLLPTLPELKHEIRNVFFGKPFNRPTPD